MTVTQLIRTLEKLKRDHGNLEVLANVERLTNPNTPECSMAGISEIAVEFVYRADDDGGIALTKAGQERGRQCITLG